MAISQNNKIMLLPAVIILASFLALKNMPFNPYALAEVHTSMRLKSFIETQGIPSNLYIHGTNSPERLIEYSKYYKNFEMDVFVGDDKLDIFHYPEHSSIDFDINHFFELRQNQPGNYWVDIKNLTVENSSVVKEKIEIIIEKYPDLSVKNFIIESKNHTAIAAISKLGFNSSYYLPSSLINNNEFFNCQEKVIDEVIKTINNNLIKIVSFPVSQSDVVNTCILPFVGDVEMASWSDSIDDTINLDLSQYKVFMVNHSLSTSVREKSRLVNKVINKATIFINKVRYKVK